MSSEVHAEDAVGRRKMPAAAAGAPVGSPWALVEYAGGSYIVADSSPDKLQILQPLPMDHPLREIVGPQLPLTAWAKYNDAVSAFMAHELAEGRDVALPEEPLPIGELTLDQFQSLLHKRQQWRESSTLAAFDRRVTAWLSKLNASAIRVARPSLADGIGVVRVGRLAQVCHWTSSISTVVQVWHPFFVSLRTELAGSTRSDVTSSVSFAYLSALSKRGAVIADALATADSISSTASGKAYGQEAAGLHAVLLAAAREHADSLSQQHCDDDDRLERSLLEGTYAPGADTCRAVALLVVACHVTLERLGAHLVGLPSSLVAFSNARDEAVLADESRDTLKDILAGAMDGGIVRPSSITDHFASADFINRAVAEHSPSGLFPSVVMFYLIGRDHLFVLSRIGDSDLYLLENDLTFRTLKLSSLLLSFAIPVLLGFPVAASTGRQSGELSEAAFSNRSSSCHPAAAAAISLAAPADPSAATVEAASDSAGGSCPITAASVGATDAAVASDPVRSLPLSDELARAVMPTSVSCMSISGASVSNAHIDSGENGVGQLEDVRRALLASEMRRHIGAEAAPRDAAQEADEGVVLVDALLGASEAVAASFEVDAAATSHALVLEELVWTDDDASAFVVVRNNGWSLGADGNIRGNMCGWTSVLRQIPQELCDLHGIRNTGNLQSVVWAAMRDIEGHAPSRLAAITAFSVKQVDNNPVPDFYSTSNIDEYLDYVSSHHAEITEVELHGLSSLFGISMHVFQRGVDRNGGIGDTGRVSIVDPLRNERAECDVSPPIVRLLYNGVNHFDELRVAASWEVDAWLADSGRVTSSAAVPGVVRFSRQRAASVLASLQQRSKYHLRERCLARVQTQINYSVGSGVLYVDGFGHLNGLCHIAATHKRESGASRMEVKEARLSRGGNALLSLLHATNMSSDIRSLLNDDLNSLELQTYASLKLDHVRGFAPTGGSYDRLQLALSELARTGTPCVGVVLVSGQARILRVTPPSALSSTKSSVFHRILRAELALCFHPFFLSHLSKSLAGSLMYVPAARMWHDGVSPRPLHILSKEALCEKFSQLRDRAMAYSKSQSTDDPPDGFLRFVPPRNLAGTGAVFDVYHEAPTRTANWIVALVVSHFDHWLHDVACPCPCPCSRGCKCNASELPFMSSCLQFHQFYGNVKLIGQNRTASMELMDVFRSGGGVAVSSGVASVLRRSSFVGEYVPALVPAQAAVLHPLGEQGPISTSPGAASLAPVVSGSTTVASDNIGNNPTRAAGQKRNRADEETLAAATGRSSTELLSCSDAFVFDPVETSAGLAIVGIQNCNGGYKLTCRTTSGALEVKRLSSIRLKYRTALLHSALRRGLTTAVLSEALRKQSSRVLQAPEIDTGLPDSVAAPRPLRAAQLRRANSDDADGSTVSSHVSDEDPDEGPAAWPDGANPRHSYVWSDNAPLDAATLHAAETVLLRRVPGKRSHDWRLNSDWHTWLVLRPGWRESRTITRAGNGHDFCTAGGAQYLWDGEWLADEVINTLLVLENRALMKHSKARAPLAATGSPSAVHPPVEKLGDSMAEPSISAAARPAGAASGGEGASAPRLQANGAPEGAPSRVFVMTSLLLKKLLTGGRGCKDGYCFDLVKKWAANRGLDVFNVDWILVPLHLGVHWALAVIDLRHREVHCYDSMADLEREHSHKLIQHLLQWLSDESAAKGGEPARIDTTAWKVLMHPADQVPQQDNGVDCGVFMLAFAFSIMRGEEFNISQADIPRFRRILAAILGGHDCRT